jgi:hypothetical protein
LPISSENHTASITQTHFQNYSCYQSTQQWSKWDSDSGIPAPGSHARRELLQQGISRKSWKEQFRQVSATAATINLYLIVAWVFLMNATLPPLHSQGVTGILGMPQLFGKSM